MKSTLFLFVCLAACGGGKSKPAAEPEATPPATETEAPAATEPAAETAPAPAPTPAPPPPPKEWHAKADLAPVKGAKLKAATFTFSQTEGGQVALTAAAPLEGLKPGKYHLVIHEAAECGANATKAGAAWPAPIDFEVAKGAPAAVDRPDLALSLDGDKKIVGHTLVLHDDKKGQPGKAVACGAIASVDAAPAE